MDFMSTAELLGNLGEFFGAIAVMVTLIYLAVQVRQNTKATKRTAFQELINHYSQLVDTALSREGAELLVRAEEGMSSLDQPDRVRMLNVAGKILAHLQNAHDQWAGGFITDGQWRQLSGISAAFFDHPSYREIWDATKERYSAEFRVWADDVALTSSFAPPWR